VIGRCGDSVPFGDEGKLGGAYVYSGQPERCIEWCHAQLARGRDTHTLTRTYLAFTLALAGRGDEARAAAHDLVEPAEATANPHVIAFALLAYGFAFRDAAPERALAAMRRGLAIAQDSGSRGTETSLSLSLSRLEARHGDPLAALDYIALAVRNYHDSGNTTTIRVPLADLATFFDRLGRYESAATISGFAFNSLTAAWVPAI
jgi:hypothetical protein